MLFRDSPASGPCSFRIGKSEIPLGGGFVNSREHQERRLANSKPLWQGILFLDDSPFEEDVCTTDTLLRPSWGFCLGIPL
ncbi:MAG: hypothetical protein B6245_13150 [Desulfobacteraceae bacterium 4572_88]|nr:MAG: hypothetical protein B6245_13150 [Desulfobacteraceae bacterium 4572_88]